MLDFKKEFIKITEEQKDKRLERKMFLDYRTTLNKKVEKIISHYNNEIPDIEFQMRSASDNPHGFSVSVKLNDYKLDDYTYLHYKPEFRSLTYNVEYVSGKGSKPNGFNDTNFQVNTITDDDIMNHLLKLIKLKYYNEIYFY